MTRLELTNLINLMGAGHAEARREVIDELYESMLELAHRVAWSGGRRGQTQTIELVHQGIVKVGSLERSWNDRQHFLATFARAIQSVRVDAYRRARSAQDALSTLVELGADRVSAEDGVDVDVLALEEALATLEGEHPLAAEVVRLRFFAQATHAEIAADLGVPEIQARRLWDRARRRLRMLLDDERD
ncbi:sigma-70 family RNA polymerase sigma factor [Engelhardtia mirabilis]|uniref:RNA polymerase sigma factor SigL n=1 Tax=Engelhardtia mirabilis TaxID=2528011 RepID=A0A518BSV9_9BACT|nr:RNA polymerase sigma factor SigL [Planctomycetes bacterium Pla133]QDV04370.1 RNA polymerase sigma factor SigL [Planctomycetes bacterium Pla86]